MENAEPGVGDAGGTLRLSGRSGEAEVDARSRPVRWIHGLGIFFGAGGGPGEASECSIGGDPGES